jgi:3-hydroxyisobutyrate dehydrogenase
MGVASLARRATCAPRAIAIVPRKHGRLDMKIGICGTGKMGAAIARRLMECGHEVQVWNRNAARTAPLVEAGAARADTPAALVDGCEAIISMVQNDAAIEAVYRGQDGILSARLRGKLVIEMSTVLPATEVALSKQVREAGGAFVECPVGGSTGPAREGKLLGLAGGSDQDVERARPILEQLCRRLEHVGDSGDGTRMKLAVNLPLLVFWQALGEALALVARLKLPTEKIVDILADSAGASAAMKPRAPEILRMLAGQPPSSPNFSLESARKDLATMVAEAAASGLTLPATQAALLSYDAALAEGLGDGDVVRVPVRVAQLPRKA